MGWYTDNLGDTPENRARDGMSVSENFANSALNGGLSGYAQSYAAARGTGASDPEAHDYAASNSGKNSYSSFNPDGSVSSYNVGDNSYSKALLSGSSKDYLSPQDLLSNSGISSNILGLLNKPEDKYTQLTPQKYEVNANREIVERNPINYDVGLTADRSKALTNMLGNNQATSTANYVMSDADYEAQLRKTYGDTFVDALPVDRKAATIAAMRKLKGGM